VILNRFIKNIVKKTINENDEYKGLHQSPSKESGAPLHNLTLVYPDDVYSDKAHIYYGHYGQLNRFLDQHAFNLVKSYKNKPNKLIKIYRTIPKVTTDLEKINQYEKHKKYILKYGKLPPGVDNFADRSEYYEYIDKEIKRLGKSGNLNEKSKINIGDWVTIFPLYAKQHGISNLNNNYKILTKTVKASEIYTNGDSIFEWGYHP